MSIAEPSDAVKRWASETSVVLQRFAFERAVKSLANRGDKLEALALIRAAYDCTVEDAQLILHGISHRGY